MKNLSFRIYRRKMLVAMLGVWGAGASFLSFGRPSPPNQPHSVADPVEKSLREDLARLGSRAYSDEGIPVFLACEDRVAATMQRPPAQPSALSQTVASDLRTHGEAWLRIFPEAPATDVSKVIEILAERDFNHRQGR